MKLFPLFADLRDRPVLVVGGGEVAARKTHALQAAGAIVTIGAPDLHPELQLALGAGTLSWREGRFEPAWLDGMWLVIAATDERDVNRQVAEAGAVRRCFVNVVDDPELSHFQVPAVIDRDPITVAISSAGAAPMFARRLREQLEAAIDPGVGALAALVAKHRSVIRERFPDMAARRAFYDRVYDSALSAQLRQGNDLAAERALQTLLANVQAAPPGRIVLVGAGPGDPGALTLAALRALNLAEMLLVAPQVPEGIATLARKDASRPPAPVHLKAWGPMLRTACRAGQCAVALTPHAGATPAELGLDQGEVDERILGLVV